MKDIFLKGVEVGFGEFLNLISKIIEEFTNSK